MRWFRLISLRLQIILLVLSFTLAVGLGNAFRAHLALDDLAQEQFERRSVATALALAAQATDLTLTNDLFALYELLNNTLVNTSDVRYIMVLGAAGEVRAHTFGPGLPRGLVEANAVPTGQAWQTRRLNTEEGYVLDVAVPLLEGHEGALRLGMSEQAITATVNRHTTHLLGLTLLSLIPVLAVTYLLGRALTQPLLKLVEVTQAIGRGELNRQAPVAGRDEVAQLGLSFNAMTQALRRSQADLTESNQALQDRNEELAALYAVATATAQADTVNRLAEAALDKALEVMALKIGWVFLVEEAGGGSLSLQVTRGLPPDAAQKIVASLSPHCLPDAVTELQEAGVAHEGQLCPCLEKCDETIQATCHAAVPLRSPTQLWGTMHLACPDPACFTPSHLRLLTAIGRQVGLAIENAHLAEGQRRELFRRRRLDQVLAAQEEERKRIARELHDELAQNLTVLIRDLESVSEPDPTNQTRLQARVRDTRTLAQRLLDQTRRLIFDLRPAALDDLGLLPALRHYAQRQLDLAHLQLRLEVLGQPRRLPSQVETSVFRIAQEAITNVVRHAQASEVQLSLNFTPQHLALTVADNGCGFDPDSILKAGNDVQHIGLMGIRERAELLGGRLEINTRPGAGTTVRVEIPVEEQ